MEAFLPVVAVVAAVAIDAFAVAGAVAGTLTALTVVTAVGATVAAVGAVTKNKTLSLVGAGLGLVGGIGSLAAGAGLLGDAASAPLFGGTAAAAPAASAAGEAPDVIGSLTGEASGGFTVSGANAGLDLVNAAGDVTVPPIPPVEGAAAAAAAPAGEGINAFATTAEPVVPTGAASTAPPTTTAPATSPMDPNAALQMPPSAVTPAAGTSGGFNAGADLVNAQGGVTVPPIPPEGGAAGGGFSFQNILDFANKNPMIAWGALQAGGQLLSGLTSTLTPAQVNALNSQAASNQAAANQTQQQLANLSQPRPVATRSPVTGQPAPLLSPIPGMPAQTGMINSNNMVPPVNVTGAPT